MHFTTVKRFLITLSGLILALPGPALLAVPPTNDLCQNAIPITLGDTLGTTAGATRDGISTCDDGTSPDVWYIYEGPITELPLAIDTVGSRFDAVVSVQARCPAQSASRFEQCSTFGCEVINAEIRCNDDAIDDQAGLLLPSDSLNRFLIRVTGKNPAEQGDFRLRIAPAAKASGQVVDATTGDPIGLGVVRTLSQVEPAYNEAMADESGRFTVEPLAPGGHQFAITRVQPYIQEVFDNLPCPSVLTYSSCYPSNGREVSLRAGEAVDSLRFELEKGGTIHGRVRDRLTGDPAVGVQVQARIGSIPVFQDRTDSLGRYVLSGLFGAEYQISVYSPGYRGRVYPDQNCGSPACHADDFETAPTVSVAPGQSVGGIDLVLDRFSGLSGKVVDAADGSPVLDARVEVRNLGRRLVRRTTVDEQGSYILAGLDPGEYYVLVQSKTHRSELLGDYPCVYPENPHCAPDRGDLLTLVAGSVETNVLFELDRFPSISGRVIDAATGKPLAGIEITAERRIVPSDRPKAVTDTDGRYRLEGLLPGTHPVQTMNAAPYVNELLGGQPCGSPACPFTDDDTVRVDFSDDLTNVDLALSLGGTVSGRVTDAATGAGLAAARVRVVDASGDYRVEVLTDSTGHYAAHALPQGFLFAHASGDHYQAMIYDDILCDGYCDPNGLGRPIPVSHDTITAGIDFALESPSGFSGTIRSLSGHPLMDVPVTVYRETGEIAGKATSNSQGLFGVSPLPAGTYFAVAGGGHEPALQAILWPNILCPSARCEVADPASGDGQPIRVERGRFTRDIDFLMSENAVIRGTVTDERTGLPLEGIRIDVWNRDHWFANHAITDAAGNYSLAVAPGRYRVSTDNGELGGVSEIFDDIPCDDGSVLRGTCSLTGPWVTPEVHVDAVADFALQVTQNCLPDGVTLCLGDGGRFRVRVGWEVEDRQSEGRAVGLTRDTGYFWFFNDDNVELVVKVLDACTLESNRFWVFAGGLTDVETTLTVTDTWTGADQLYTNTSGQAFQPILDTRAFATCNVFNDSVSHASANLFDTLPKPEPEALLCNGDLCLNEQRFKVEAFWNAPDGSGARADGVPLTGDSGYFWFFNADNVELVVKVLNGCGEPQNTYWVFAAGLTDVEVLLRVTDTVHGEVREYLNSQGTPFQPILDTQAFDTCP